MPLFLSQGSHIETSADEGSLYLAQVFAVQPHGCGVVDALKGQGQVLPVFDDGRGKLLAVPVVLLVQ